MASLTIHCVKDPAATFSGTRLTPLDVRSRPYLGFQRLTLMHSSPSLKVMTRMCIERKLLEDLVPANLFHSWKYELTRIMDENGYTESTLYTYEYGLEMARFWSDV